MYKNVYIFLLNIYNIVYTMSERGIMITYDRFFDFIKKKGYTQNELIRKEIINARLLNALKNNKSVTTKSLNELCNKLDCNIDDILEYKSDK